MATDIIERGTDLYGINVSVGYPSPLAKALFYDHKSLFKYRAVSNLLCADEPKKSLDLFLDSIALSSVIQRFKLERESYIQIFI